MFGFISWHFCRRSANSARCVSKIKCVCLLFRCSFSRRHSRDENSDVIYSVLADKNKRHDICFNFSTCDLTDSVVTQLLSATHSADRMRSLNVGADGRPYAKFETSPRRALALCAFGFFGPTCSQTRHPNRCFH